MIDPDDTEPQPPGFRTPAIFANRFSIRVDGEISRIVFLDGIVGKFGAERAHITMKTSDLVSLGDAIADLKNKMKPPT